MTGLSPCLLLLGVVQDPALPTEGTEQDEEAAARAWTVGGFVDASYVFNNNQPHNHIYRGTNTTPRTNEFTIPAAGAYLLRVPDAVPFRFELALHAGAAVDALYAAEPVPGGETGRVAGTDVWKHLALANVGGKVGRTRTELGAGLFHGPMGIGGFWSKDNWNYSPSWESNAAPFYVAGARLRQDIRVGVMEAWVVNGWQTLADVNAGPSYIVGANLGGSTLRFGQWVYFGPEQADTDLDAWRVHTDTFVILDRPRWGGAAVWDFGQELRTDRPGHPRHLWTGGALFGRVRLIQSPDTTWDLAARPEVWWDRDGVMFGARQWLASFTFTSTVVLWTHLQVRLEYRFDRSTARDGYFYVAAQTRDESPDLAREQQTLFLALVGTFDHSFGL